MFERKWKHLIMGAILSVAITLSSSVQGEDSGGGNSSFNQGSGKSLKSYKPFGYSSYPSSARQDSYAVDPVPAAGDHGGSSSYAAPSNSYASPSSGGYAMPMSGGYAMPSSSYGSPMPTSGYGSPMPSSSYGTPMSGTYHYQLMPESNAGYGDSGGDSGGGSGSGLAGLLGLLGLLGLKGLKPLIPLILPLIFPLIAPLLLPILLPLLLLALIPLLPLILLLPIPVVTIPVPGRNFVDSTARHMVQNFLDEKENCVERISCEISNRLSRKGTTGQNLKWAMKNLDDWLQSDKSASNSTSRQSNTTKFLHKLSKGVQHGIKGREKEKVSSPITCSVYDKCKVYDAIRKLYTEFSDKSKVEKVEKKPAA